MTIIKSKINFFYLLAFLPLVPIAYYFYVSGRSILGVLIPSYGFLLLLLKKDQLSLFPDPIELQRFLGIGSVLASFFVFYVMAGFYSSVFYGVGAVFYTVYVLGLFLVFFSVRALRESVSVFFLVVAGALSFYISEWLEYYMEPLVPYFVNFFVLVLRVLGISVTIRNPTSILLNTPKGFVPVAFEAGCIGIHSFLVFSIIAVVTMLEESASRRTKLLWSIGGVIGTFFINTIRVSLIAVVIYYFGYERWGEIHAWIGYALFLLWLMLFFVTFSKREAIRKKILELSQKF